MYAALPGIAVMFVGCAGPVDRTANASFKQAIGATTMTVFPAYVRRGDEVAYDSSAAEQIGAFLEDERLATPTYSEEKVPIGTPWRINQARMLRESAAAFAAYLAEHPVETEYALLPEYLGGSRDFGGVHSYIVDAQNRLAYVFLQNSHWPIFQDVSPKTTNDCTEILIRVLRLDLAPSTSDE
jgi:hypothetical protein